MPERMSGGRATARPRRQPAGRFVQAAFVFVTLFVFVGTNPFAQRVRLEDLAETGDGSFGRQLILLLAALVGGGALVLRHGGRPFVLLRVVPWPVLVLLGWCLLTLTWSPFPEVGLRRLAQTAILIFMVFAFVQCLGPQRALRLLALTLVGLVCLSVLFAPVLPNGIHGAGERDASLIGAWRGFFFHKNQAGVAALLAVIMSDFFMRLERRRFWMLGILFGVLLLLLSKSKTAFFLLVPVLICGMFAERYLRGVLSMSLTFFLVTLSAVVLGTLILVNFDTVAAILADPQAFTGRVGIWMTLSGVISDNVVGGVGYGSLYDVGEGSVITKYGDAWVSLMAHAHNGYVELWAAIGLVGLVLAVGLFLLKPLRSLLSARGVMPPLLAMLISIIALVIVHNTMETTLMHRSAPLWFVLLVVVASTQHLAGVATTRRPRSDHARHSRFGVPS
ncbi:MAG: O-antigen ligase family protein [Rhodocyclaceae bacterium]